MRRLATSLKRKASWWLELAMYSFRLELAFDWLYDSQAVCPGAEHRYP
jgi:hypothetical protein